MSHMQA